MISTLAWCPEGYDFGGVFFVCFHCCCHFSGFLLFVCLVGYFCFGFLVVRLFGVFVAFLGGFLLVLGLFHKFVKTEEVL